jgi:Neocarzinostatin family/Family of unknown function (DUF6299)
MRFNIKRRAPIVAVIAIAMTLVWAVPASAATALVVTPNTDLVDFQSVTVTGSGFPADTQLAVVQCTVGATDPFNDCDLSVLQFPLSDGNGNFSTPFTVQRLINTSAGQIDCAPSNCEVFSSGLDLSNPTSAALQFDPNVPPQPRLQLDLTVDPKGTVVGKTGEVTVTGTVTCSLPADVFIDVAIQQRAGRVLIQGDAFGDVQCDGTTPWSATGQGFNGILKGGSAQVDAIAEGSAGQQNAFAETFATIKLTGGRIH